MGRSCHHCIHHSWVFKLDKPKPPARNRDCTRGRERERKREREGERGRWVGGGDLFFLMPGGWFWSFITMQSVTVPNCSKYTFMLAERGREGERERDFARDPAHRSDARTKHLTGPAPLTVLRVPAQTPHKDLPEERDDTVSRPKPPKMATLSHPGSYSGDFALSIIAEAPGGK